MKRKLLIQSGVTLVVLFVLAFGVSVKQAYATTGCFTDTVGNWAETFICWMKDNGITGGVTPTTYAPNANVTRAEMAVFLQRVANIPPSTGDMYIVQSLSDLEPGGNFTSVASVRVYSDYTAMFSSAVGSNWYTLLATVPASLYGRGTFLKGVQVCYQATHGATLSIVEFIHAGYAAGASTIRNILADSTARTDATCRTYSFTTPLQVLGSDHVALSFAVTFATTNEYLPISSVAFILAPSTLTGGLTAPEQEAVPEPALLPNSGTMIGSNP
jgi:hypothetical protein